MPVDSRDDVFDNTSSFHKMSKPGKNDSSDGMEATDSFHKMTQPTSKKPREDRFEVEVSFNKMARPANNRRQKIEIIDFENEMP